MPEEPEQFLTAVVSTPCARPVVDRLCAAKLAGAIRAELNGDEGVEAIRAKLTDLAGEALVALVLLPETGRAPQDVVEVDLEAWRTGMAILPLMSRVLQALRLTDCDRLTVVCLGAQIALTGSSGMALMSAVQEGQRSLIKAAARQWGSGPFRAHWLGIHPSQLASVLSCGDVPQKQDSVVRAMEAPPSLERIASLLPLLASVEADVLTGATLMAEGGGWMVP